MKYEDALTDAEEREGSAGGRMLRNGLAALEDTLGEIRKSTTRIGDEATSIAHASQDGVPASEAGQRLLEETNRLRELRMKAAIAAQDVANAIHDLQDEAPPEA